MILSVVSVILCHSGLFWHEFGDDLGFVVYGVSVCGRDGRYGDVCF